VVRKLGDGRGFFSEDGFTLVEVVAVLLLLAILATITFPSLRKTVNTFMLEEAAWRMARELRLLQQQAVWEGETVRVQFQHSLNRSAVRRGGETVDILELPRGIEMGQTTFARQEVFFYPSGAPSGGGTIPLIHSGDGQIRYIKVTVGVGRVRVARE
jgi:type II secretion system protein H